MTRYWLSAISTNVRERIMVECNLNQCEGGKIGWVQFQPMWGRESWLSAISANVRKESWLSAISTNAIREENSFECNFNQCAGGNLGWVQLQPMNWKPSCPRPAREEPSLAGDTKSPLDPQKVKTRLPVWSESPWCFPYPQPRDAPDCGG